MQLRRELAALKRVLHFKTQATRTNIGDSRTIATWINEEQTNSRIQNFRKRQPSYIRRASLHPTTHNPAYEDDYSDDRGSLLMQPKKSTGGMSGAMSMFGGSPKKGSKGSSSSFNNPLSRPSSVMSNGYIGVTTPGASAAQDEYEANAEFAAANQALSRQGSEKLGDVFALKSGLRDANDANNNPKMKHHVSLKFGNGSVPGAVGKSDGGVRVLSTGGGDDSEDDLDDLDLGAFAGGNESTVNSPTGDENTTFGFGDDASSMASDE